MTDSSGAQIGETMKYLPFGETLSGTLPTDKLFTGQRLDETGLYYYGARYYDPIIGRFTKPDEIVQNPNNPQCYNRYSYTLNNPLKYLDPSGNIVEINGWNVNTLDALKSAIPYLPQETASLVADAVASPLYRAYDTLRSADSAMFNALEAAEETIKINLGDPGSEYDAVYSWGTNTITMNEDWDFSSHENIINLAHEIRHAWQDAVGSELGGDSLFDHMKWFDEVYLEWDAYKYMADIDDSLGWGVCGGIWNNAEFFQKLDLENSWDDYQIALNRFNNGFWDMFSWWELSTPTFLALTEDMYNNK